MVTCCWQTVYLGVFRRAWLYLSWILNFIVENGCFLFIFYLLLKLYLTLFVMVFITRFIEYVTCTATSMSFCITFCNLVEVVFSYERWHGQNDPTKCELPN